MYIHRVIILIILILRGIIKLLLIVLLTVCPAAMCCQYPADNGTSEPSVQDQGTQFAVETSSMTETTPSGSWDNGGVTDNSTGSSDCWSGYDN
jgi:hypothetical protein